MTQYTGTPKLPASIYLADASTPFNPAAITPADAANWDAVQALQGQGFYKTTLNGFKSPVVVGDYTNTGTYRLGGGLVLTSTSTNVTYSTARLYYRAASLIARFDTGQWSTALDLSNPEAYYTALVLAPTALKFGIELPDDCVLKKAAIKLAPDNGHVALPATMPKIRVFMTDNVAGTTSLLAEADDTSASAAAYNLLHTMSVTLPDTPFKSRQHTLIIQIRGEAGANAIANMIAYIPWVEFTRAELGQEFGETVP